MSLKSMAARFKFTLQFAIVVNLAVENDRGCAITARHRLVTSGKFDDRQPAHAEGDSIIHQRSLIVWPAMRNHTTHALQHGARFARVAMLISANKSVDATHRFYQSKDLLLV